MTRRYVGYTETAANALLDQYAQLGLNVQARGAAGDGTTDDYAAIAAVSSDLGSEGRMFFPPGTYRIGTNLTINCEAIFALGATLEPDAGVTVTLAGPVTTAPGASIIASGAAGTVSITGAVNGSGGAFDVASFGADPTGAVSSTAAFQAAIDAAEAAGGGEVVARYGTYLMTAAIVMRSGVTVRCAGVLDATSTSTIVNPVVLFSGVTDARWIGGTLSGNATTATQTGFSVTGASARIEVSEFYADDFLNKGINVGGTSTDVLIQPIRITGSTGATGVGCSVFSVDAHRVTIRGGYYTGNRVGISINGGTGHTAIAPNCSGNTDAGFMFDGVVTNAGDGPKYSRLIGGNFDDNGPSTAFGGVYYGNGASYNQIIGVACRNNAGAGIRSSSTYGVNDNVGVQIVAPICESNDNSGIVLSVSQQTIITSPRCEDNTGRGIYLFSSDNCQVLGGILDGNSTAGIQVQAAGATIQGVRSTNNATGIQVSTGGGGGANGNVVESCTVGSNSGADYSLAAGTTRVLDSTGALTVVTDMTDANLSVTFGPVNTVRLAVPIAAGRTLTLQNTNVVSGDRIRVVRTAAATGAFSLTISASGFGTLRALANPSEWAEATFDGTFWVLTAYGTL